MITTRVRSFHFEKILIAESVVRRVSNWVRFQMSIWGRQVNQ